MKTALAHWPLSFFCIAFTLFALVAPEGFYNPDAVVYAEQIREANFAERTTHLGYYLLAYPLSFLPFSLSHSLNLLSCAFGAGVVVLVGLIGEAVTGSRTVGPLAAVVVAANSFLVGNALHAEVYIAQTFFLMLAIYLWLLGRPVLAGLGSAAAFLVSASAALAAPLFVVMRPKWRPLLLLAATAALSAVVVLAPVLENYLFGARGLLGAAGVTVDYKLAALKAGRDVFFGFFALTPFLVAGAAECWRRPDLRRFGLALAAMWAAVFAFGEKYMDVPVQLPTYALGGIVAAIGIEATLGGNKRPAMVGAILALCLIGAVLLVAPFTPAVYADHLPTATELALYAMPALLIAAVLTLGTSVGRLAAALALVVACNLIVIAMHEAETRDTLERTERLAEQVRRTPGAVVVAKWNDMVRINWLVHHTAYNPSSFDVDAIDGRHERRETFASFTQSLGWQPPVVLLEPSRALERMLTAMGYRREGGMPIWLKRAPLWLRDD